MVEWGGYCGCLSILVFFFLIGLVISCIKIIIVVFFFLIGLVISYIKIMGIVVAIIIVLIIILGIIGNNKNENLEIPAQPNISTETLQNSDYTPEIETTRVIENDIVWQEIVEPAIINFSNNPLEELLTNLIGQKDRVSCEVFCQGEKVYFCVACQLGYHEESWEYLNRRCADCQSSNVRMYTLPRVSLREIKQTTTTDDFSIDMDDSLCWGTEIHEDYISALDLDSIRRNVGKTISVKGQIRSVRLGKNNNIIYFHFTENPYQGFYTYVLANSGHNFPNAITYSGKNVFVYGTISVGKRKRPRMILNDTWQLRNIE